MVAQYASIVPQSLKPCLKRPQSQPARENNSSQPQNEVHNNEANSSQKCSSNGNRREVHWHEPMHNVNDSGSRVRRVDGRWDKEPVNVSQRDHPARSHQRLWDGKITYVSQRDQPVRSPHRQCDGKITYASHEGQRAPWSQRQRGEKMTDTSRGGQHVQWSDTQRHFRTSEISHRGQHAQLPRIQEDFKIRGLSHSQGKGEPFRQDTKMSSHDQRRYQHIRHDARMTSHDQGKSQHTQRDAVSTSHGQRRDQPAQQDARKVSHDLVSPHHAERNYGTIDASKSNTNSRKDQPGFIGEFQCKPLLAQIYADIHAASLPGAIQATADLAQLPLLEGRQFVTQNWFQCNVALQTQSMFKVIGKQRLLPSLKLLLMIHRVCIRWARTM